MYQTIKVVIRMLFVGLVFTMAMFLSANGSMAMDMEKGHDMASHHQHLMLNHALGMTLEGYNMIMIGTMVLVAPAETPARSPKPEFDDRLYWCRNPNTAFCD